MEISEVAVADGSTVSTINRTAGRDFELRVILRVILN